MTIGIGIIGRELVIDFAGGAVVGVNSKGITLNNELLDTTDDESSGFAEKLATAGLKSAEFTMSGILKNLELIAAWSGSSQIFAVTKTYPDGSTLAFDAAMESYSHTGESNSLITFDASFSSSGPIVFTAGT